MTPQTRSRRTPPLLLPFRLVFVLVRTVVMTVAAILGGLASALRWSAAGRTPAAAPPLPAPPVPPPAPAPLPQPVAAPRRPLARPKKSGGTGQRVLFIAAVVGVVAVVLSVADDGRRRVAAPPAQTSLRSLRPDRLQEYAADNAIVGGASVALLAHADRADDEPAAGPVTFVQLRPVPPVPPAPPAPPMPTVRTFHTSAKVRADAAPAKSRQATQAFKVRSATPHPTRREAEEDAREVARKALAEQLQELDPPVHTRPSARFVDQHIAARSVAEVLPTADQQQAWEAAGLPADQRWVELEVSGLTAEEVRQLRAEERVRVAGKATVVPFVLALALYGFLRFDAWTKGYLTVALGVGMAALAGGAVALVALVR